MSATAFWDPCPELTGPLGFRKKRAGDCRETGPELFQTRVKYKSRKSADRCPLTVTKAIGLREVPFSEESTELKGPVMREDCTVSLPPSPRH